MKTIKAKKQLKTSPQVKIKVVGYYSELNRRVYKRKFSRKVAELRTQIRIERKKTKSLLSALLKVTSLENRIAEAKANIKELGYNFKRYTNRIKAQMNLRAYKYSLSSSLRSLLF